MSRLFEFSDFLFKHFPADEPLEVGTFYVLEL